MRGSCGFCIAIRGRNCPPGTAIGWAFFRGATARAGKRRCRAPAGAAWKLWKRAYGEHLSPEPVDIPAALGLERGVWFLIPEGIRGVLVRDERGRPHVYMLTQPASHYYQIMTRNNRMPVLLGEQI